MSEVAELRKQLFTAEDQLKHWREACELWQERYSNERIANAQLASENEKLRAELALYDDEPAVAE